MRYVAVIVLIITVLMGLTSECATAAESRWESAIRSFEKQDTRKPFPKNGVVFVGSSSIRKWDLERWFPKIKPLNRGFGGSEVSDSVEFIEALVLKHEPRAVVVYAGDNDIAHEETPQQIRTDFRQLVSLIHERLPKTKVIYIAVKPSIARWSMIKEVRQTNRLINEITAKDERLEFVDIDQPMLGADGKPREELFIADGLHLSDKGYAIWTASVRPLLSQ